MNHLADSVLQRFLDEDASLNRSDVESHLDSCVRCREELAVHRMLRTELARVEPVELPLNFADRIVERIESLQEARERRQEWFWMILIAIAGIAVTLYYSSIPMNLNSGQIGNNLKSMENYLPAVQRFGGWMGEHLDLLIFGLFLVLLFDVLDKKLLRLRTHH